MSASQTGFANTFIFSRWWMAGDTSSTQGRGRLARRARCNRSRLALSRKRAPERFRSEATENERLPVEPRVRAEAIGLERPLRPLTRRQYRNCLFRRRARPTCAPSPLRLERNRSIQQKSCLAVSERSDRRKGWLQQFLASQQQSTLETGSTGGGDRS
jgi:hypothetical protein